MPERPHALRVLQHHLRQAGSLVAAGDLEAASAHIDAALAIDSASPAALTLRDRIRRAAPSGPSPRSAESFRPLQSSPGASAAVEPEAAPVPARFVPNGVDPTSWVSFEARIEERRFRSLLAVIEQAAAHGDGIAARLALEEARDLRPDAPELGAVTERVALLPVAQPVEVNNSVFRARAVRAASILAFGVTLVMAIDWFRSEPATVANSDAVWELDTPPSLDEPGLATSVVRRAAEPIALAESPEPDLRTAAAAPPSEEASPDITVDAPAPPSPESREPIQREELTANAPRLRADVAPTTVRNSAVPPAGEIPDDYVSPRQTTSETRELARTTPPRGEVPDDYVAPQPERARNEADAPPLPPLSAAARGEARASRDAPAPTNIVRQSAPLPRSGSGARSSTAPSPESPSAERTTERAEAGGAAVVVPRDPATAVTSVLEQYASAYERLDARAARQIWPTVNERALAEAFAELESQHVTFDDCEIDVQGETANASCSGSQRYVVKVGNREPRTEPRSWQIGLKRNGEDWVIDSVRMQ